MAMTPVVWEPYLASLVAPLPVLALYGRSAKGPEGGRVWDTMWYAFRDLRALACMLLGVRVRVLSFSHLWITSFTCVHIIVHRAW